jgi:hypothetical protein
LYLLSWLLHLHGSHGVEVVSPVTVSCCAAGNGTKGIMHLFAGVELATVTCKAFEQPGVDPVSLPLNLNGFDGSGARTETVL